MDTKNPIVLYEWILQEFTLDRRAGFVNSLAPYLAALLHPGDRGLDLCCGTGPFSFFFEELAARVTAIDVSPGMIRLAREEAAKKRSAVTFIQADVLTYGWDTEQFDVVVLLGNTVSDFPLDGLVRLGDKVSAALRPGGSFAVHYLDGLYPFVEGEYARQEVQQEEPQQITRRFKEYRPESAAYVEEYTNTVTGDVCEYTSYLYGPPYLRLALGGVFELTRAIALGTKGHLDIFSKKQQHLETRRHSTDPSRLRLT